MSKMGRYPVLLLLVLVIAFSGCKQKKELAKANVLNRIDYQVLRDSVKANEADFDMLSVRVKVGFKTSKMSDSFKMHVRMKKDSLIWISATYYKVEVARFILRPDSVYMMDRKNHKYYIGDYSFIQEKFQVPFDFNSLQAVLLGNSLNVDNSDKVRNYSARGRHVISALKVQEVKDTTVRKGPIKRVYSMWVNPNDFRITKTKITESKSKKGMEIAYADWRDVAGFALPHKAEMKVTDKEEMLFSTEYLKVTTETELTFPFKISDKYEPFF